MSALLEAARGTDVLALEVTCSDWLGELDAAAAQHGYQLRVARPGRLSMVVTEDVTQMATLALSKGFDRPAPIDLLEDMWGTRKSNPRPAAWRVPPPRSGVHGKPVLSSWRPHKSRSTRSSFGSRPPARMAGGGATRAPPWGLGSWFPQAALRRPSPKSVAHGPTTRAWGCRRAPWTSLRRGGLDLITNGTGRSAKVDLP